MTASGSGLDVLAVSDACEGDEAHRAEPEHFDCVPCAQQDDQVEPSPFGAGVSDSAAQELDGSDVGRGEQYRGHAPFESAAGVDGIADTVRREGPAGLFCGLGGDRARRQRRLARSLMNIAASFNTVRVIQKRRVGVDPRRGDLIHADSAGCSGYDHRVTGRDRIRDKFPPVSSYRMRRARRRSSSPAGVR